MRTRASQWRVATPSIGCFCTYVCHYEHLSAVPRTARARGIRREIDCCPCSPKGIRRVCLLVAGGRTAARRRTPCRSCCMRSSSLKGPNKEYTYIRNVRIAGSRGPLALIQKRKNPRARIPFPWHATGAEIVQQISGPEISNEVIIDLKPYQENVSLYRLLNVWGYSYEGWTPVALHLEALFVDRPESSPKRFKRRFLDRGARRDQIGEFLYLQGGVREGKWNWGMVGRVNGALLWPDAFEYLASSLKGVLS